MGGGGELGMRMDRLAKKVESGGGVPVADGLGRSIWCELCEQLQPLHRPFATFRWNTHVCSESHMHKAAVRLCA